MKQYKILFGILTFSCMSFSCKDNTSKDYEQEINEWKETRLERLKGKTGWLNLAGLYWLNEGVNTFGSDSSNSIIFPAPGKTYYGLIEKSGDSLILKPNPSAGITVDGLAISEINLVTDAYPKPSLMESGSFAWYVIKRNERYGIRLRDYNNPRINQLDHIPAYKISGKWRIEADFIKYDTVRKIEIPTVTGGTEINSCPGELIFRIGGEKYRLLPFSEGNDFFIIFADKTNGIETYGNGRFMYASLPDKYNKVILDFNKAYNPPCAFSPFATCPMPPRENILDLKIEAGEKEVHP